MRSDAEKQILARYQQRIENELNPKNNTFNSKGKNFDLNEMNETSSEEYNTFLEESLPSAYDYYEKFCNQAEKLLKIKAPKKKEQEFIKAIDESHINVTPSGIISFSYLVPILMIIFFGMLSYILLESLFMLIFFFILGITLISPLQKIPSNAGIKMRMRASNQMILAIFYIVTYMKHTSNLEKAMEFASNQLIHPLGTDLKRVIWNVETQKYSNIKESLDNYLEKWRNTNDHFIEAMHLIESSLYEGYEERRVDLLEKSLDVILDGTFEKMLHYAQNLKSPINTLNMLGVILPILGLVILPLAVSFMDGIRWFHILALYNIALPLGVYLFGQQILTTRPSGYGAITIENRTNECEYKVLGLKFKTTPLKVGISLFIFFMLIGFSPIIINLIKPDFDISVTFEIGYWDETQIEYYNNENATIKLIDYQPFEELVLKGKPDAKLGPFGLGAALLSILIPLGIGVSLGTFFRLRSEDVVKIRENTKKLESEFSSALFQLANRLSDGMPAEIAFPRVAEIMKDTYAGQFFVAVSNNISNLGFGVNDALFHKEVGALNQFPSPLIKSSMKVLSQSALKGPQIAGQAMMNVARYLKEIHRVDERLKDLMSEIISAMRSQITFLSPAISGIVIGITSMITNILGKLGSQMKDLSSAGGSGGEGLMEMFGQGIPTFHFQIIVGIYVVQIAYILTVISNSIENGDDPIGEDYILGIMIIKSVKLYAILTIIIMLIFNFIAIAIISKGGVS
jgi:Flp pilus assembly protein TadB